MSWNNCEENFFSKSYQKAGLISWDVGQSNITNVS